MSNLKSLAAKTRTIPRSHVRWWPVVRRHALEALYPLRVALGWRDPLRHRRCACGVLHYAPHHHKEPNVARSERYEAYYCTRCGVWLDDCCGDPECHHCKDRPERVNVPQPSHNVQDAEMESLGAREAEVLTRRLEAAGYTLRWHCAQRRRLVFAVRDGVTHDLGVGVTRRKALRDLCKRLDL